MATNDILDNEVPNVAPSSRDPQAWAEHSDLNLPKVWDIVKRSLPFADKLTGAIPQYGLFLVVGRGGKGKSVVAQQFCVDAIRQGWVKDLTVEKLAEYTRLLGGAEYDVVQRAMSNRFIFIPSNSFVEERGKKKKNVVIKPIFGGEPDSDFSFDYMMAQLMTIDLTKVDVVLIDSLREMSLRRDKIVALARAVDGGHFEQHSSINSFFFTEAQAQSEEEADAQQEKSKPGSRLMADRFVRAGLDYYPGLEPTSQIYPGGATAQFCVVLGVLNRLAKVNRCRMFALFNPQLGDSAELRQTLGESVAGVVSLDSLSATTYRTIASGAAHRVGASKSLVDLSDVQSDLVEQQVAFYTSDSNQLEEV